MCQKKSLFYFIKKQEWHRKEFGFAECLNYNSKDCQWQIKLELMIGHKIQYMYFDVSYWKKICDGPMFLFKIMEMALK